jgi:hypothetical protein
MKKTGMWNLVQWQKGIEGWSLALLTRELGVKSPRLCSPKLEANRSFAVVLHGSAGVP